MILASENCQNPIVFLTAVLTWDWGEKWLRPFIIHRIKLLEPNRATKKSHSFLWKPF
jgi:hypothetical protein